MDRVTEHSESRVNHIGQTSGSGLGLSLVIRFVTKMNGHIWVSNSENGGAVFSFCFPSANTDPAEERSTHSSMGELPQYRDVNTSSLNVMLVDDSSKFPVGSRSVPLTAHRTLTVAFVVSCPPSSVINLKVLERMFYRVGVKSVVKFNDASKALVYLNELEDTTLLPDLILSDLTMPVMTGLEFMCHLREISTFDSPPTVMACSGKF